MHADHSHSHTLVADAPANASSEDALGGLRELAAELKASRTRIVEASDAAQRRIERDLHDGAQQRLVSASLALARATRTAERGDLDDVVRLLGQVREELDAGLSELRDLARGIHPAVLTDRGLRAAVDALAARSAVAVRVEGDLTERPAPAVESALYFTTAEALTNVAKYARATEAVVTITGSEHQAEVEVSDDGLGGADPEKGSGLRGLVDRLGALGGHLHVDSLRASAHGYAPSSRFIRSCQATWRAVVAPRASAAAAPERCRNAVGPRGRRRPPVFGIGVGLRRSRAGAVRRPAGVSAHVRAALVSQRLLGAPPYGGQLAQFVQASAACSADDLERHGGRNYVSDAVPSEPDLHRAIGT